MMAGEIESLAFFQDRAALIADPSVNRVKSTDRTTTLIKKWQEISNSLKRGRLETMTCCEVVELKNVPSLKIADRSRFNALQTATEEDTAKLASIEDAIKKLDALGAGLWFRDLEDRVGSYGRVEHVERQQIARMSAGYLQKGANSGLSPEEILKDPEFQRLKKISEDQIEDANKQLATLRPRLEEVTQILESVGC